MLNTKTSIGLLVIVSLVVACMYAAKKEPKITTSQYLLSTQFDVTSPFCIERRSLAGPDISLTDEWFASQVQLPQESEFPSVSICLHVLRYHGLNQTLNDPRVGSTEELLRILLDCRLGNRFFERPVLVETPFGVRFRTLARSALNREYALESHRDQSLAALAKLGVPLEQDVRIDETSRSFKVKHILLDSIANFVSSQPEITWSLEAYLLYLAPLGLVEWENRLGEVFTFDAIVSEIMNRSLQSGSCGGTHRVSSIALAVQVDETHSILSPDVRSQCIAWLKGNLKKFRAALGSDGAVGTSWYLFDGQQSQSKIVDNRESKIIASSHWAEILQILPGNTWTSESDERRLLAFLASACRDFDKPTSRLFCPYMHSVGALRNSS